MPLTIREQSEELKAAAAERLPAEVLEVFDRSIEDFLDRGIPAKAVKAGDVLEAARRYFDSADAQIVVVGDRQAIAEQAALFGEVEVYDPLGNRL